MQWSAIACPPHCHPPHTVQRLVVFVAIPLCHDGLSLADALSGEAECDLRKLSARAGYSLLMDFGPSFNAPADDDASFITATDAAAHFWKIELPALNCSKAAHSVSQRRLLQ